MALPLNKETRGILTALSGSLFADNARLASLRAEITAASQTKAERRAAIRNEHSDKDVRDGVAALASIKAQIEALQASASELDDAITARVDVILAESGPDADTTEARRAFAETRKEVVYAHDAFVKVASNLVGPDGVAEFLAENDWQDIASLRGGQSGKSGDGPKRPRFDSVTVDGVDMAKATLSAAAAYLVSKGHKGIKASDILAAFPEGVDAVREGSHSWPFTAANASGTSVTYTISTSANGDDSEADDSESEDTEDTED